MRQLAGSGGGLIVFLRPFINNAGLASYLARSIRSVARAANGRRLDGGTILE